MCHFSLKRLRTMCRSVGGAVSLSLVFLLIEFYDEFYYAVGYTALPAIRRDLALSYAQIGLLLGLPGILNTFIEPLLMLLGDTPLRRHILLGGGIVMAFTAFAMAGVTSFPVLLWAEILCFPASGAFVTLSQATLMDSNRGREAQMMARWSLSGSLANLVGPLLLGGGFALALGWRWAYGGMAIFGGILTMMVWQRPLPAHLPSNGQRPAGIAPVIKELIVSLWAALRNRRLLRWEGLLLLSDLLLDVFTGYAALYFADVAGLSQAHTAWVLSAMMLAGLVSDAVLIPLLEKYDGLRLVRFSAALVIPLYMAFLLVPWLWAKVFLVIAIKLGTLGWWPVLEGQTFATVPGKSGTVKAVGSLMGLAAGALTYTIGWVAENAGLATAMWLLLAGPVALVGFVPGDEAASSARNERLGYD